MKKTIEFLLFALVVECFSSTMKAVSFPSESYGSDETSSMTSNVTNSYMTNSSVENNNVYTDPNAELQSENNVNKENLGAVAIDDVNDYVTSIILRPGTGSALRVNVYTGSASELSVGSQVTLGGVEYTLATTGSYNNVVYNLTDSKGYLFLVDESGQLAAGGGASVIDIVPLSESPIFFLLLLIPYAFLKMKRKSAFV
jgi:hypothetical protein